MAKHENEGSSEMSGSNPGPLGLAGPRDLGLLRLGWGALSPRGEGRPSDSALPGQRGGRTVTW